MELKILEKNENKLIDRIEIKAKASFTGATPSNEQVRDSIASKMKAKAENIVVKGINTVYGFPEANVIAFVYKSVESRDKFESRLGKKALEKIEKGKKAAEDAKQKAKEEAAAPKEEEKKPETKEEKPVEEKKEAKEEKPAEDTKKEEEAAPKEEEKPETKEEPAVEEKKEAKAEKAAEEPKPEEKSK